MKMKMKMKNRSYRYDINGPRSRHGHKYSTYQLCRSVMMVICMKQHSKLNLCKSLATLRLS